jgi:malonyl-CoA O-methyltransferase
VIWRSGDDLYAAWAPRYPAEAHNPLMAVEEHAIRSLLPPLARRRALDAGCGTGRYARLLSAAGAITVAVDRSPSMLAHAVACGASYIRGDIRALPLASTCVDLIVSGLMLPDVADLAAVVQEWRRVLTPGGIVVCSTLHPAGADLGWTRTFETPHGTHMLPAHWHTVDDYRDSCSAAGLVVDAVVEPTLQRDDGAGWRRAAPRVPVALVLRARRPRLA